jgi:hypothetical protein
MLGRLIGSNVIIYFIKFFNYGEYIAGIAGYSPFTIFNANICNEFAMKGGWRAHNSYRTAPIDQISDLNEYGLFSII